MLSQEMLFNEQFVHITAKSPSDFYRFEHIILSATNDNNLEFRHVDQDEFGQTEVVRSIKFKLEIIERTGCKILEKVNGD